MRKILTIIFLLLINTLFAQLAPGTYSYSNTDARITFTITEDGQMKDCIIKGTNDKSMVLLRPYREKSNDKKIESWLSGTGTFIKNVTDPTKKTVYVGYYIVGGEFPTYNIRIKKEPETISIIIEGVPLTLNIEPKTN